MVMTSVCIECCNQQPVGRHDYCKIHAEQTHNINNKSSAVAQMGDRGHNRHGLKGEGGGCCAPFAEYWEPI